MRRTISKTNTTIICRNNDIYKFEFPVQGAEMTKEGYCRVKR